MHTCNVELGMLSYTLIPHGQLSLDGPHMPLTLNNLGKPINVSIENKSFKIRRKFHSLSCKSVPTFPFLKIKYNNNNKPSSHFSHPKKIGRLTCFCETRSSTNREVNLTSHPRSYLMCVYLGTGCTFDKTNP